MKTPLLILLLLFIGLKPTFAQTEEKARRRALILSKSDDEALPYCDFSLKYKTDQYQTKVKLFQQEKSVIDEHNKEVKKRYGRLISDAQTFLKTLTNEERTLLKEEGNINGALPFKEKERKKIIEGLQARFEAFNKNIQANNYYCERKGAVKSDEMGYCEILVKKPGQSPTREKLKASKSGISAWARLERLAPDRFPQGAHEVHTTLNFYSSPNVDGYIPQDEYNQVIVKIGDPKEEEAQIQKQVDALYLTLATPPPPSLDEFLKEEVHPVCFKPDRPHVVQGDRSSGKEVAKKSSTPAAPKKGGATKH